MNFYRSEWCLLREWHYVEFMNSSDFIHWYLNSTWIIRVAISQSFSKHFQQVHVLVLEQLLYTCIRKLSVCNGKVVVLTVVWLARYCYMCISIVLKSIVLQKFPCVTVYLKFVTYMSKSTLSFLKGVQSILYFSVKENHGQLVWNRSV